MTNATRKLAVLLAAAALLSLLPAGASAISGTRPWVVVLCNFSDHTGTPNPVSYYEHLFGAAGNGELGAFDYWRDVSYSQLDITGTVVKGWYTLSMTRNEFNAFGRYNRMKTCAQAADADVNFANFYGVVVIPEQGSTPDPPGGPVTTTLASGIDAVTTTITVTSSAGFPAPPFGASIDANTPSAEQVKVTAVNTVTNQWTVIRGFECCGNPITPQPHAAGAPVAWQSGADIGSFLGPVSFPFDGGVTLGTAILPSDTNVTGATHEMGHGFSYDHSRRLSTSTTDYNDCWDLMSAFSCVYTFNNAGTPFGGSNLGSQVGAKGPGLNAIMLDFQGWLSPARRTSFANGSCTQQTYTMAALNHPGAAGWMEIRSPASITIPIPNSATTTSDYYTVELRSKTGWDRGVPEDAFVLHLHGLDGFSYWVDGATADGRLVAGEEFVDLANNTVVAVNSITPGSFQGVLTLGACKINAALTYTGATSGQYSDPATLAADLTVSGSSAPVPFENVTFTLGSQSCSDVTDAAGHASCSLTLNQVPGPYTVTASFAGNSAYNAATASAAFTIQKEATQVTYTGPADGDYHDPVTLSGTLVDPDASGGPIAGRTVGFTIGATDTCSGTTDGAGHASCTLTPNQVPALYSVVTSFAGDPYYLASTDTDPFEITKEETFTTYTGPHVIAQGLPVTLSGHLEEDTPVPIMGRTLTLRVGSQSCTGVTDVAGNASCTIPIVSVPLGPQPLAAEFAGDAYYLPSSDTDDTAIVFGFPSRGAFVLGDATVAAASPSTTLTWWSHSWPTFNTLTGGPAPDSFKGFAGTPRPAPPACGGTWTTQPGNSTPPVSDVPSYMGVLVASSVTKSGSTISGNVTRIVVVITDPGYEPAPGHPGTGRIVAAFC